MNSNVFERLDHPVIQAPIGSASSVELAIAVADAGAMGSLAMTWTSPEDARSQLLHIKEQTQGLVAANFVLSFAPQSLDAALAAGVDIVTFSWGINADLVKQAQAGGAAVGVQIGSVDGARRAIACGADFLICQGLEAGGHVQSSIALASLLSQVTASTAGQLPVVAAGGLADADDVASVIENGASAAMLGTRFVTAIESKAHDAYRQAIVDAEQNSTAYTWCFDGDWPYSGHRVLRNSTLEIWESHGCPLPGQRPGENEIVATTQGGWEIPRYHIASPVDTTTGDVEGLALYAGTGSAKINAVQPAATIVKELSI